MKKFYQAIGWIVGKVYEKDGNYILEWNKTTTPVFFPKVSKNKIKDEVLGKPLVFCVYPIVALNKKKEVKSLKFQCAYWDNALPLDMKPNQFVIKGVYTVFKSDDEQNYIQTFRNHTKQLKNDKIATIPKYYPVDYRHSQVAPFIVGSKPSEENHGYFLQLNCEWNEKRKLFVVNGEIEEPSSIIPKKYQCINKNGKNSNKSQPFIKGEKRSKPSIGNNQAGN